MVGIVPLPGPSISSLLSFSECVLAVAVTPHGFGRFPPTLRQLLIKRDTAVASPIHAGYDVGFGAIPIVPDGGGKREPDDTASQSWNCDGEVRT